VVVAEEPKDDTGPEPRSVERLRLHAHARISDPKPPRNQNPKRDSSKAFKRRFSQTVIHCLRTKERRTRPGTRPRRGPARSRGPRPRPAQALGPGPVTHSLRQPRSHASASAMDQRQRWSVSQFRQKATATRFRHGVTVEVGRPIAEARVLGAEVFAPRAGLSARQTSVPPRRSASPIAEGLTGSPKRLPQTRLRGA
jgi:hypothetical protein